MFAFQCPRHGRRVLVWPSDVESVSQVDGHNALTFHCSCGYRGVLITGDREVIIGLDEAELAA